MKLYQSIFLIFFIVISSLASGIIWSAELTKPGDSQHLKYNEEILLQDFSGKSHKLSEYYGKGKWLIVMIWASDCHICNIEVKNYITFHNKHKDVDATILGISVDGWEFKANAEKFIKKHKVNFPNLIAAPIVVDHLYELQTGKNLYGTPSFLVYSPTGELKAEQTGAVPTSLIEEFIKKFKKQ
ncbi:MAG: TlpA family protein disulfide reductase [Gammaproteobacteria bacterium]